MKKMNSLEKIFKKIAHTMKKITRSSIRIKNFRRGKNNKSTSHFKILPATIHEIDTSSPNQEDKEHKHLEEVFIAIETVVKILEKETDKHKLEKVELIFKFMSVAKKDLALQKQLSSDINDIAIRDPRLAKALQELKEKLSCYHGNLNLKDIAEHTLYFRRRLKAIVRHINTANNGNNHKKITQTLVSNIT